MTFAVAAKTDAGTLMYLWQQNGVNLLPQPAGVYGVTTNTLTITNVQENMEKFRCVVSNAPGSTTTSNTAQLTLRECLYFG